VTYNRFRSRISLKLGPRIKLCDKGVKYLFWLCFGCFGCVWLALPYRACFERSLDLQGLVENLGKVIQNGGFADDQGRPSRLRGRWQLRGTFAAESDDRQMSC
jgi:hypothetical protein